MRIAIVSDIHGNLTALEAVLADLRVTAPDRVLHGGDLADSGSNPAEVVDRIRDLNWAGVLGNTDEIQIRPASLDAFAAQSPAMPDLWKAVREIADATREALGEQRLAWMRTLPGIQIHESGVALIHASPYDLWRAPGPDATADELAALYSPLVVRTIIYGHIHRPFIRRASDRLTVINSGSVGLPYDGDPRASYVILDHNLPTIRRVEYDVEREIQALRDHRRPHADWIAQMLRTGAPSYILRA